ncbi:MAG: hypothetical protein EKK50_15885 [Sphingomonadaceae bacterium]|nr:MAG: hypothetical protein EKK50_15885 [Sphingomonadaceae bacterium]
MRGRIGDGDVLDAERGLGFEEDGGFHGNGLSCFVFVIPADAGIHGFDIAGGARPRQVIASMDPGFRRDDDTVADQRAGRSAA